MTDDCDVNSQCSDDPIINRLLLVQKDVDQLLYVDVLRILGSLYLYFLIRILYGSASAQPRDVCKLWKPVCDSWKTENRRRRCSIRCRRFLTCLQQQYQKYYILVLFLLLLRLLPAPLKHFRDGPNSNRNNTMQKMSKGCAII